MKLVRPGSIASARCCRIFFAIVVQRLRVAEATQEIKSPAVRLVFHHPLRQAEGLRQGRADRMLVRILIKDCCTYLPFESKLAALPLAAASDAFGRFETSQTRTVQSWLAEAISLLSALNATRMIAPS